MKSVYIVGGRRWGWSPPTLKIEDRKTSKLINYDVINIK